MDALSDRSWFALAVGAYGVASAHALFIWRRGNWSAEGWNHGVLAVGLGLHTIALLRRGFSLDRCPVTNLFEAVMFVTWILGAAGLLAGLWPKLRFAGAIVAPGLVAAGVFGLQPRLDEPSLEFDLERSAVSLHVALVLLAYAAFGAASVAAALYLVREQPGDSQRRRELAHRLPSKERLERVLLRSLGIGLVLMTAGLATSLGLMSERYGVMLRPDLKILWSVLVWAVYLGLVVSRLKFHQASRRIAWGAIAGFGFLLLTFWGTNLLSPIHHP